MQAHADHITPDDNPNKERIGDAMGGKVLELQSEILEKRGIEKGIKQGIAQGVKIGEVKNMYSLVNKGIISLAVALQECGLTEEEFYRIGQAQVK